MRHSRALLVFLACGFQAAACGSAALRPDAGTAHDSGDLGGTGGGQAAGGSTGSDAASGSVDSQASGGSGGTGAAGTSGGVDAGGGGDVPAVRDAASDAPDAAGCASPRSCAVIHACDATLASGNYAIFPDGPTDAAPTMVHCDMDTAGGGWTVIFLANNINLASTVIAYTVPAQSIRDAAQEALMSFRNLNLNMAASDWASFALPPSWRAKNPLAVSLPEELTVSASVNGALPGPALLRYGVSNFGTVCGDAWSTTANDLYGRICLQGTAAAFFSGYAIAVPTTDYCSISNQTYSTRVCSDTARFSIAVR